MPPGAGIITREPHCGAIAGLSIRIKYIFESIQGCYCNRGERVLDQRRNPVKSEPGFKKGRYRGFVRGVEHRRRAAADAQRLARQLQAWKASVIWLGKTQPAYRDEIEIVHSRLDAIRVTQRECDRRAHIRIAELSQ